MSTEDPRPLTWFTTADVAAARDRLAANRYGGEHDLHDLDHGDITEIIQIVLTATWQRGVAEGRRQATEDFGADEEWAISYTLNGDPKPPEYGGHIFDSREEAERHLDAWRRHYPDLTYTDEVYHRREVLTGPWEPTEQAASPMEPLIRVVPGMPSDTLLAASPRLDEQCRRRDCDHVHEVATRFGAEQAAAPVKPRTLGDCPRCGKPITGFHGEPVTTMATSGGFLEVWTMSRTYEPCGCFEIRDVRSRDEDEQAGGDR